jgi:hypothetical protein
MLACSGNRRSRLPRACGCLLVLVTALALWSIAAPPARAWDTGFCNSLVPGQSSPNVPGDIGATWLPVQQEAINQTEELYGQTAGTDPGNRTALVTGRAVTRAFMFADLVKAIHDVHDGTATATETSEVSSFNDVVRYERETIAAKAIDLWNAYADSPAYQSTTTNSILQLVFGAIGLPWRDEIHIPTAEELLSQAETEFWGPPSTRAGVNPNYPIGGAESAQALHQASDALSFLNALGQTEVETPSETGTDSALGTALGAFENALGEVSAGELAEGIIQVKELGSTLASGENDFEPTGSFIALANLVFTAVSAGDTAATLNADFNKAQNDGIDLEEVLADPAGFSEVFNDFVAQTLHTVPNAGATGNDPDCRTSNKPANAALPAADDTFTVSHIDSANPFASDYHYTTQTLGGTTASGPAVPNGVNAVNDPSVVDWSYTRDEGPGAPRVYGQAAGSSCEAPSAATGNDHNPTCGGQWPISQVTYGIPGDAGAGFGLRNPSVYYPANGHWYLTFNGANGQQHTTAALTVSSDGKTVHPTDSEVAQAIANADPQDFPTVACGTNPPDPATPPADQGTPPCLDWNPVTHLGTDLIVSGNQPNGNTNAPPDYQVIFNIMVKGDLGRWAPRFVAHGGQGPGQPSDCTLANGDSIGGVCVSTLFLGFPLAGDVVQSQTIWPQQQSDLCPNDPLTCDETASYGWPTPYPVTPECQAISPAAGMFDLKFVGVVNTGNQSGSCANAAVDRSFTVTPSIRYRAFNGSLWTAWRVPPTVGQSRFLNIEDAQLLGGETAGIDGYCRPPADENAVCLVGSGTHWTSEFQPGDTIMLQDPSSPQNNDLGGLLAVTRKVEKVDDDTHMELSSSAECVNGSDGNDCMMFNTEAYTSFMNPSDGSVGSQHGMLTLCVTSDCVEGSPVLRFDVYKLTALNPGTTCPVWDPATAAHPPTSGCYYSNALQFQSQTAGQDGQSRWWNMSLPAFPPVPHVAKAATTRAHWAADAATDPLEPWLDLPVVTQDPQSALVSPGAHATFGAAATGSPAPSVQWQRSTDGGSEWVAVPGATSATLTLIGVEASQSGDAYRAVFTNTQGSRPTRFATLSVATPPAITQQPGALPTPQPGQTFTLTADASGVPQPAPEWQASTDGGLTWHDISGGQTSLSLLWPQTLPVSPLIRVIYANSAGSATSRPALLGPPSNVPGGPSDTVPPASSGTATGGAVSLPTAAEIRAALMKVLVPHGKGAKIAQLLKNHGYRVAFSGPSAGRLVIGWYQVPKGARLPNASRQGKGKPKPKLVATVSTEVQRIGRVSITIRLTALGKRLLGHSRTIKLTAKGTFTPSGGPATSVTKSFRLKR